MVRTLCLARRGKDLITPEVLLEKYRGFRFELEGESTHIDLAIFNRENIEIAMDVSWVDQLDPELFRLLKESKAERDAARFIVYFSHMDDDAMELIEQFEEEQGELNYRHCLRMSDSDNRPPRDPGPEASDLAKSFYKSKAAEFTPPELPLAEDFSNAPKIKALLHWVREHYFEVGGLRPSN